MWYTVTYLLTESFDVLATLSNDTARKLFVRQNGTFSKLQFLIKTVNTHTHWMCVSLENAIDFLVSFFSIECGRPKPCV